MLERQRPFVSVKFDAVGRVHRFLLPEVDFEPPLDPGEPVVVTRGEHRAYGTVTRSMPQLAGCLRRSLLIGQLHLRGRRGKDRSRAPVDWSNERDLRDGLHHA